jgi:glycosyltransferase involved in cell wall biosynthesis
MPLPEDYSKPRLKPGRVDSESKFPQLTVISVIYNTPEMYLRRTIESVLTQSYTNFRYLIIDHGSDDGVTSKVISEYSELDKRINVIRTEKNYVNELRAGRCEDMSELHNVVFDNVSTKYTCMIDSDDCFADGYFETAYNLLEKEDADVYFMGAISYAENTFDKGDFWASFNLPPCDKIAVTEEEKIFNYANAYASIGGWGMMCKTGLFREAYRRVWANGKITSDLKAGYYVAMKASKSIYGKDVCLYYVNRENAVSTALKRKILERLDNVVGLVLQERLCEMRTSLIEKKLDYKKILYNYTDYNLKVLIQYIEAINAEELDSATKESVFKILKSLISDCYVEKVLKSRRYCEFEVQMNKFCEV